jgi:hypothetical protein
MNQNRIAQTVMSKRKLKRNTKQIFSFVFSIVLERDRWQNRADYDYHIPYPCLGYAIWNLIFLHSYTLVPIVWLILQICFVLTFRLNPLMRHRYSHVVSEQARYGLEKVAKFSQGYTSSSNIGLFWRLKPTCLPHGYLFMSL